MTPRKVLLIEDGDSRRKATTKELKRMGYAVVGASGGREGLRVLGEERPDIVLLDVGMPEADVTRALELIRSVSGVPVVMLTVRESERELGERIEGILRRTTVGRRDGLTGLGNHLAFHEHLDARFADGSTGMELSVVMIDLDDFKAVNERHGHPAGDDALKDVARVILRHLRLEEEAFRVGGDEFAIVVEGLAEAGIAVAERVRRALGGQLRGRMLPTMSAGVAASPSDAAAKDDLLEKARAALHLAKTRGRNAVVGHMRSPEPDASGVEKFTEITSAGL